MEERRFLRRETYQLSTKFTVLHGSGSLLNHQLHRIPWQKDYRDSHAVPMITRHGDASYYINGIPPLFFNHLTPVPAAHQIAMRATCTAVSFLCALLLLHFFLSFPSPPQREFTRERSRPRKLLLLSHGAVAKPPVIAVSASLRRLPPSKSNPSHNKKNRD
ncbi:hypothetical protein MUK42_33832 [Musa troglodytarum]|uniref:Uncharacterized protein n=1 Tax=Musa troglodytarum TaxID=320322 RepID=A0A9E7KLK6_9LILI|nr:hypothetical protein MUK42_33832 [Musa troglodytarum]